VAYAAAAVELNNFVQAEKRRKTAEKFAA